MPRYLELPGTPRDSAALKKAQWSTSLTHNVGPRSRHRARYEQSSAEIWEAVGRAVRAALEAAAVKPEDVHGARRQGADLNAEVERLRTEIAQERLAAQQAKEALVKVQAEAQATDGAQVVKETECEELRAVLEVTKAELAEVKKWGEVPAAGPDSAFLQG